MKLKEQLNSWCDAMLPYLERAFAGSRLRSIGVAALFIWLFSAGAALWVVHSDSGLAQDARQEFRLEPSERMHVNWNQCGFCVTARDPLEKSRLEQTILNTSQAAIEHCATGMDSRRCDSLSGQWFELLISMPRVAPGVGGLMFPNAKTGSPTRYEVWKQGRNASFRPTVELYRSPLSAGDFGRVWGLVCSVLLFVAAIVVVPLRVIAVMGREIYNRTWILLMATQQSPHRIVFSLVEQALAPLAVIALPLWFSAVSMMVLAGDPLTALAVTLAWAVLALVWTAFAVTLTALAGRRGSPAILMLVALVPSLLYALISSSDSLSYPRPTNSMGDIFARLLFESGLNAWNWPRFALSDPLVAQLVAEAPVLLESVANGVLGVCTLLWIGAHAGRFTPLGRPCLSRRGWLAAWALAALVLGARWAVGVQELLECEGMSYACSNPAHPAGLTTLILLVVPLASYLRSPVHPLLHRPECRLGLRLWGRSWGDSVLAMLLLTLGQAVGAYALVSYSLVRMDPRDILLSVVVLGGWAALVSGLMMLLSGGLARWYAKLVFGTGVLASVFLLPFFLGYLTQRNFSGGTSYVFDKFELGSPMVALQGLLFAIVMGALARAIRKGGGR